MATALLIHDQEGLDFSPNPDDRILYKVTGDNTDGLFDYFDLQVGHLQGFPLHIHIGQHETFHIVDGELLLIHEADWIVAKKGDFVFVPKNTEHTFANVRRTVAHSVGVISPGGFDKFVAGMKGETEAKHGHPDPKKVEELCIQFNQKLTGPTLAIKLGLVPEPGKAAAFNAELDALQGTWSPAEGTGSVEIDGNKLGILVDEKRDWEGVARFDPTRSPKAIEFLHLAGPLKGKSDAGIYELDGDQLKILCPFTGRGPARPTGYSGGADDASSVLTLRRRKS